MITGRYTEDVRIKQGAAIRLVILSAILLIVGTVTVYGAEKEQVTGIRILQASYEFTAGTGTAQDPYQIQSVEDLLHVKDYPDAYYKQMQDLDLSSYPDWEGCDFYGVYEGNGHVITNLTSTKTGLFSNVGGKIRNLGIVSGKIELGHRNIGAFGGNLQDGGQLINCYNEGCRVIQTNTSMPQWAAGLFGGISGTNVRVENCYSLAEITNSQGNAAGLLGVASANASIKIKNCYYAGILSSGSNYGIIGADASTWTTENCFYNAERNPSAKAGGGEQKTTAEMQSPQFSSVLGEAFVYVPSGYPALSEELKSAIYVYTAEDFYNIRNNQSGYYIQMEDISLADYPEWTNYDFSGIYDGNGHTIRDLYAVNCGLFSNVSGMIKNLGVISGEVTSNNRNIGAFGGNLAAGATIWNCYNGGCSVSANGKKAAGGLFGGCTGADVKIENCYNLAPISSTGERACGILAVSNDLASVSITNCYQAGTLQGTQVYPITAITNQCDITNCYYDKEVLPNVPNENRAMGKTTSEMKAVDFPGQLGSAFVFREGNYPALSGRAQSVIEIYTAEDLYQVRNNPAGSYVQKVDIDLESYPQWEGCSFYGTYDGGDHIIRNLNSTKTGLFENVGGTIKNLGIISGNIRNGKSDTGAFGNKLEKGARLLNCYNAGCYVSGMGAGAGGLFGSCTGGDIAVESCYNWADVQSDQSAGGLIATAGGAGSVTVRNCYNTGQITAPTAGALSCIPIKQITLENCYYDKETSQADDIYGMTGMSTEEMQEVEFAVRLGEPYRYVHNEYPTFSSDPRSYHYIYTAEDLYQIRNAINDNYIQMQDIDLSAYPDWNGCNFYGTYDGNGYVIRNLNSTTTGLFSNLSGATIKDSGIVSGNVQMSSNIIRNIGAFGGNVGENSVILNCYNSGCTVTGSFTETAVKSAAGLFGGITGTNVVIQNCYNHATINAPKAAGIVAEASSTGITIENCYNTGKLESTHESNPISFITGSYATYKNCYYLEDGVKNDSKYTAKTENEMKTPLFSVMLGEAYGYVEGEYPRHRTDQNCFTYVYTAEDLYNVRLNPDGNYVQMCDIDLSTYPDWTASHLSGIYDGNGFSIKNLKSTKYGLFYNVSGTIKNLGIVSGEIRSTTTAVGAFGRNLLSNAQILNCYNAGCTVITDNALAGGLFAGCVGDKILLRNCYNWAVITSNSAPVGGIVSSGSGTSDMGRCIFENCYNAGRLESSSRRASITGVPLSDTVASLSHCYYDKEISNADDYGAEPVTTAQLQAADFIVNLGDAFAHQAKGYPILSNQQSGSTPQIPPMKASISELEAMAGQQVTWTASYVPGNPQNTTYAWYRSTKKGGSQFETTPIAETKDLVFTPTLDDDGYFYKFTAKNTVGSSSAIAKLSIIYGPELNAVYPLDQTVDEGSDTEFVINMKTAGYPAEYTYQWYRNGTEIKGAKASVYKTSAITAENQGDRYSCTVTHTATGQQIQSREAVLQVRTAPQPPTFTVSRDGWDKTILTFTIKEGGNAPIGGQTLQYQIGTGTWTEYKGGFVSVATHGETPVNVRAVNTESPGLVSAEQSFTARVDLKAPTGTIRIGGSEIFSNWLETIVFELFYKEQTTVVIDTEDSGSGVAEVKYLYTTNKKVMTQRELDEAEGWVSYTDQHFQFNLVPNDAYTVYARVTDKTGWVTYLCSNGIIVDNEKPTLQCAIAPEGWTNGNVTLTAAASDSLSGLPDNAYSFQGAAYQASGVYTASENETVKVAVKDLAGNIEEQEIAITNIDKEKPQITEIKRVPDDWTKGTVTLQVTASDTGGSGLAEYGFLIGDGQNPVWQAAATYQITENTDVRVKTKDNAGNESDWDTDPAASLKVENIDQTAPQITVSDMQEGSWQQKKTLRVDASDTQSGISKITYCLPNESQERILWTKGAEDGETTSLQVDLEELTQMGIYQFYAYDNVLEENKNVGKAQVELKQVDVLAPEIGEFEVTKETASSENKQVKVTIQDLDASGIAKVEFAAATGYDEQSGPVFEQTAWTLLENGSNAVVNGTEWTAEYQFSIPDDGKNYYLRATDKAGNTNTPALIYDGKNVVHVRIPSCLDFATIFDKTGTAFFAPEYQVENQNNLNLVEVVLKELKTQPGSEFTLADGNSLSVEPATHSLKLISGADAGGLTGIGSGISLPQQSEVSLGVLSQYQADMTGNHRGCFSLEGQIASDYPNTLPTKRATFKAVMEFRVRQTE